MTRYEYDRTQGLACAVAAGADTVYRNYFAPVGARIGRTCDRHIDCLLRIGQGFDATATKAAGTLGR